MSRNAADASGSGSGAAGAAGASGAAHGAAAGEAAPHGAQKGEQGVRQRKPYTITKRRESWTQDEHRKFVQALQMYDRDWKKIETYVGTKSVIQIRSHAQKYFLKVQKNGTGEHVPPPRPKRKSAKPYPRAGDGKGGEPGAPEGAAPGARANAQAAAAAAGRGAGAGAGAAGRKAAARPKVEVEGAGARAAGEGSQGNSAHFAQGRAGGAGRGAGRDAGPQGAARPAIGAADVGPMTSSSAMRRAADPGARRHGAFKGGPAPGPAQQGRDSPGGRPGGGQEPAADAQPDFSVVYGYLSSLFEPSSAKERIERLAAVEAVDRHTIVLLMQNLIANLQNPQMWNEQMRLIVLGQPNFVLEKQPYR